MLSAIEVKKLLKMLATFNGSVMLFPLIFKEMLFALLFFFLFKYSLIPCQIFLLFLELR